MLLHLNREQMFAHNYLFSLFLSQNCNPILPFPLLKCFSTLKLPKTVTTIFSSSVKLMFNVHHLLYLLLLFQKTSYSFLS